MIRASRTSIDAGLHACDPLSTGSCTVALSLGAYPLPDCQISDATKRPLGARPRAQVVSKLADLVVLIWTNYRM